MVVPSGTYSRATTLKEQQQDSPQAFSDIKREVLTVGTSCMEDSIRCECCITLHPKQLQMAYEESSRESKRRLNSMCHCAEVSELTEELRLVFLKKKFRRTADVWHMCYVELCKRQKMLYSLRMFSKMECVVTEFFRI